MSINEDKMQRRRDWVNEQAREIYYNYEKTRVQRLDALIDLFDELKDSDSWSTQCAADEIDAWIDKLTLDAKE